jgi:conjugative transfer region protein TrbK
MDGKTLARIGAVVFVAIAITATAIEMTRKADRQNSPATQPRRDGARSARAELARCSGMGEAGARDPSCLRLGREPRRFLGAGPAPAPTAPATFPRPPMSPARPPQAEPGGSLIMGGTGVIDHFLEVFTRYIDSGFGLLGGEVGSSPPR